MQKKWAPEAKNTTHACDYPGCEEPGTFRAPKDRTLRAYYWFCQKHVAEYNKNWDFLKGMTADEIEQQLQHDITWQRPTWKLGHGPVKSDPRIGDPLHIRSDFGLGMDGRHNPPPPPQVPREKKYAAALALLEISGEVSLALVKKQYKKLAKKYHPDTNGGDKEAVKRFQKLVSAYEYVCARLGESRP